MGGSRFEDLSEALDRSIDLLDGLVGSVNQLDSRLQVIESRSKLTRLSIAELRIPETVSALILVAGSALRNDPLTDSVARSRDSFSESFAFIEVGDFAETQAACDRVRAIVEAKIMSRFSATPSIVNLRWAPMPRFLEQSKTVVMGIRFCKDVEQRLTRLKERLVREGFQVLEDNNEYGGGPLVYSLARSMNSHTGLVIVELTLSSTVARQPKVVKKMLDAISKV